MKKVLLTVALLGSVAIANAQISKGRIFVGGSLGFSTSSGTREAATKMDLASSSSFSINPLGAYYLTDNIAIGAEILYSTSSNDDKLTPTATKTTNSSFGIGPFVRYNMPLADKFGFYLDAGLSYSSLTMKTEATPAPAAGQLKDETGSVLGLAVSPGFVWFVRDNISLQGTMKNLIGYSSMATEDPNTTPTTKTSQSAFTFDVSSLVPTFGLYYYFGGSK